MNGMTEQDGTPPQRPDASPMLETNTLAVVSFVVSLFWLFGLASIVAVVLGALALSQIERTGGRQYGKGLAMLGIALGVIGVVAAIVFVVMLGNRIEHETL
jgi:Domain of unknown function (DUF4190)